MIPYKTWNKFRGIKKIELFEVIVAEGRGIEKDPIREVHYFCDDNGKIIFMKDPCSNENCRRKK